MTGLELKQLRWRVGITAKEASEQAGVTMRTWFRWERSKSVNPGREKAFLLSNARKISKIKKEMNDGK